MRLESLKTLCSCSMNTTLPFLCDHCVGENGRWQSRSLHLEVSMCHFIHRDGKPQLCFLFRFIRITSHCLLLSSRLPAAGRCRLQCPRPLPAAGRYGRHERRTAKPVAPRFETFAV